VNIALQCFCLRSIIRSTPSRQRENGAPTRGRKFRLGQTEMQRVSAISTCFKGEWAYLEKWEFHAFVKMKSAVHGSHWQRAGKVDSSW